MTDPGNFRSDAPWRHAFDNARDPYTARNALGVSATDLSGYLTITDAATTYQPLDADLTAIAALSGTNTIYYRSAANTWTGVTVGGNLTFSGGTLNAAGGSTTQAGAVELATTAEMITGTSTALVPSVAAVRGGTGAGWASFYANKNNTDQTGVASVTATQITFGNEVYNVGSYFASNGWTPPLGKVRINAGYFAIGTITAGSVCVIYLYKDGALAHQALGSAVTSSAAAYITFQDAASGSNVYTIYAYITTSAGTATILGANNSTWFQGTMID